MAAGIPGNGAAAAARLVEALREFPTRIGHWARRYRLPGDTFLLGLALLVGLGTGLLDVAFRWAIRAAHAGLLEGIPARLGAWAIALAPVAGGLIAGPLVARVAPEARGHGVPEVMAAVALRGGRIRGRVAAAKLVASAATIGSGGPVGKEGPIIQIGAAVGSAVGQALRLPAAQLVLLVAAGAAAGISATFNAPIAGVLFAAEIILGEISARAIPVMAVAAVAAAATSHAAFGDEIAIRVQPYSLVHPVELAFYFVLGVLAAVVGTAFVRVLYRAEDAFDRLERVPRWLRPALGGLGVGAIALLAPAVLGTGQGAIGDAVAGRLGMGLLLTYLLLRIAGTSLALGSGASGGVFSPSLFMGAMLGGSLGALVHTWLPRWTAPAGAYALVGMGAVVAGATHAPIQAIVIVFEMTRDYRIILPLMLACVTASWLAGRMSYATIYTLKLLRRGIDLRAGRDVNLMRQLVVADAMHAGAVTVPVDATCGDVVRLMQETRHGGFPVTDDAGRLVGIITLDDLRRIPSPAERLQTPVRRAMTAPVQVAHPDESLEHALETLAHYHVGRLPVVDPADPGRVVGIITRSDILDAYNRAIVSAHHAAGITHGTAHGDTFAHSRAGAATPGA